MKNISYILPNWFGTGLVNQLFFIILGIINAHKNKNSLLIIDKFRLEPLKNDMCPISEIIDIEHLNELTKNLNIKVIDRKDSFSFSIDKILYGAENKYYDITDFILSNFYFNGQLNIPNGFILNEIRGDPIVGFKKYLKIYFKVNGNQYIDEYDEYLFDGVNIDLNSPDVVSSWNKIDYVIKNERPLFNYLLKNIKFVNKYYKLLQNLILIDKNYNYIHIDDLNINNLDKKINVIHLRLEKDITYNISHHNNIEEKKFISILEDKYIGLIEKYFDKNDIIFVLAYEINNNVINYLKDNGYEFYFTKKNMFEWREPHAILDLLLSEKCNGTYIGNWQHYKTDNMGSSFSYAIENRIREKVDRVFIDWYDIKKNELVI